MPNLKVNPSIRWDEVTRAFNKMGCILPATVVRDENPTTVGIHIYLSTVTVMPKSKLFAGTILDPRGDKLYGARVHGSPSGGLDLVTNLTLGEPPPATPP